MKRTTIFADEELLQSLKHIATKEGVSVAELTRQALTKFIADRQEKKHLSFLGIGNSGKSDIADRSEDLLWEHTSVKPKAKR